MPPNPRDNAPNTNHPGQHIRFFLHARDWLKIEGDEVSMGTTPREPVLPRVFSACEEPTTAQELGASPLNWVTAAFGFVEDSLAVLIDRARSQFISEAGPPGRHVSATATVTAALQIGSSIDTAHDFRRLTTIRHAPNWRPQGRQRQCVMPATCCQHVDAGQMSYPGPPKPGVPLARAVSWRIIAQRIYLPSRLC